VIYNFVDGFHVMMHNHYESRQYMLKTMETLPMSSPSLGLTQKDLSLCSDYVAEAYKESVDDGVRAGTGYMKLGMAFFALSALLFLTSVVGIQAVNRIRNNVKAVSS